GFESFHRAPQKIDRPPKVADREVRLTRTIVRLSVEREIADLCGEREGLLTGLDGSAMVAKVPEACAHVHDHRPEPMAILELCREHRGFAQVIEDPRVLPEVN